MTSVADRSLSRETTAFGLPVTETLPAHPAVDRVQPNEPVPASRGIVTEIAPLPKPIELAIVYLLLA